MEQEKVINTETTYSVNVAGSQIESLRVNNNLKTTVRVYDNGCIGVAGAIGECDENELLEKAKGNLSQNISYPCILTENQTKKVENIKEIIAPEKFVATAKSLINKLNERFPDYVFSNKFNMSNESIIYENSKNTRLEYSTNNVMVSLAVQKKGSGNILDFDLGYFSNRYDEDEYVEDMATLIDNYDNKVELPDDNLPVIIDSRILSRMLSEMVAENYVLGSSLFKDKLGSKIFDERVNIYLDRKEDNSEGVPFFDAEGVVPQDGRFYFVKDGVFSGLITNKRSATKFNLPLSSCAAASFDGVPSVGLSLVSMQHTAEGSNALAKDAIYVALTSGGDMTPSGDMGLPVMLAYLIRDGKIVGRLPEFSLGANVFDLLGKDFIGFAKCDLFKLCKDDVIVANFKINKQ